jgi:hypothetical protein
MSLTAEVTMAVESEGWVVYLLSPCGEVIIPPPQCGSKNASDS